MVREVGQNQIRAGGAKFVLRVPAGRHSDDLRTDCTGAAHIMGCIADDPHAAGVDTPNPRLGFPQSGTGDIIPMFVNVAKPAEAEVFPKAIVLQLVLGTLADIPGEEANVKMTDLLKRLEDVRDAGQHLPWLTSQSRWQPGQIARNQAVDVRLAGCDTVPRQQIPANRPIGAAAVRNFGCRQGNGKFFHQSGFNRHFARATRADQRTVNVEQEDRLHRGAHMGEVVGTITKELNYRWQVRIPVSIEECGKGFSFGIASHTPDGRA